MTLENYINRENVEVLLSQLVKIHSPYFKEEKVMDFAYNWLKSKGLPAEYHRYTEDKVTKFQGINVIGEVNGKEDGPTILLNGHLDTVGICEGWTKEPLNPTIEGDKMYGVGALDMKSGSAAIMLAVNAFKNTVKHFKGNILYTFVSDEEGPYGLGTDALILDGITDHADVAIVPEPSSGFSGVSFPCLCLGARGGWNYTVHVMGKSAHAANPQLGISAIVESAKLMLELKNTELREDDKLGKGSICIISSDGGGAACSVADTASFTVFRHVVRGEDKEYIKQEVLDAAKRAGVKGDIVVTFRDAPHPDNGGFEPYTVEEDNHYTKLIKESILKATGKDANIAYFSSIGDFNYLGSRVGIPTFVFGPDGENYHTSDEYVNLNTVVDTAKVIYDFLLRTLAI
ncbi:M20 family metallopeptidase [Clostridiisalibacter paucivorans]|uniref:M20 family metallopeptidase n=1 Tax=Clostridiisalibacter paucivorans TaxID=408753 RepID=UPI000AFF1528|nr:M20/M25/M40 family metallo-hydrolase [Clostridiisalibacter paucivorans]